MKVPKGAKKRTAGTSKAAQRTKKGKAGSVSHESEIESKTLFDSINDSIFIHDLRGRILEVNGVACERLGYSREELLKMTPKDIDSPDFPHLFPERIKELRKKERVLFESSHRTKDGRFIPVEISGRLIKFGGIPAILVIARDIKDRKHSEEARYFLASLMENSKDAIIGKTLDGVIVSWNKGAQIIYGYAPEEVIGRSISMLAPPECSKEFLQILEKIKKGEVVEHFETVRLKKNGERVCVSLTVSPIGDASGRIFGASTIAYDITRRKRMEEVLGESEGQMRAILDNVQTGIMLIDPETHRIVDVNPAASRLIGAPKEKIIDSVCHKYVCPAEVGLCPITDLKQTVDNSERILLTSSGESRPIMKTVTTLTLKGRKHLLESFIDIMELKRVEEALRESEERFRSVVQTANEAIVSIDGEGKITFWNRAAEKMFGYFTNEIFGKPVTTIMPERYIEGHRKGMEGVLNTGETRVMGKTVEMSAKRKDGTEFPIELSLASRRTREGIFFSAVIRDITNRKLAEDALHASEERYRLLFERNVAGVFRSTVEGEILDCNPAFAQILGFKNREELKKYQAQQLYVNPEDREEFISLLRRNPILTDVELRVRHRNGHSIWILENVSLFKTGDGKEILEGTIIDITKRKIAEEKLSSIYDLSKDMSMSLNLEEIAEKILESCERLFKFNTVSLFLIDEERQELYVKKERGYPEGLPTFRLSLKEDRGLTVWAARHGESVMVGDVLCDQRYAKGDLEVSIRSELVVPLKIGNRVIGVLDAESEKLNAFTEDDRRLLETLASQASVAIENARLFEELASSNKLKEMFISIMSHDLKNPLTVIRGYNELLSGVSDRKAGGYTRKIEESVQKMIDMINSSRLYSKVKNDKYRHDFQRLELGNIIESAIVSLSEKAKEKSISIIFAKKNPAVFAHRTLENVFLNVIDNAIKYSPPEGNVEIEMEEKEDRVVVCVKDFGKGIPDQYKKEIFEKFERGKVEGIEGFGLGLAIAKEIVSRHEGRVWVEDNIPCGSVFFVELPKTKGNL